MDLPLVYKRCKTDRGRGASGIRGREFKRGWKSLVRKKEKWGGSRIEADSRLQKQKEIGKDQKNEKVKKTKKCVEKRRGIKEEEKMGKKNGNKKGKEEKSE